MKKVLFFYLMCTCVGFSRASSTPQWRLHRSYGKTLIYISENATRLNLQYQTTSPYKNNFSIPLLKIYEADKRKLLSLAGIKNWQVHHRLKTKEKNGNTGVVFSGSYTAPSGRKIYFEEYHFYGTKKQLQILLTNENKKSLMRDRGTASLQGFRVQYGL